MDQIKNLFPNFLPSFIWKKQARTGRITEIFSFGMNKKIHVDFKARVATEYRDPHFNRENSQHAHNTNLIEKYHSKIQPNDGKQKLSPNIVTVS